MPYGKFNSYEEVAIKFKIRLIEESFIKKSPLAVNSVLMDFIQDNLSSRRNYVSESAICESIISPILTIVAKAHGIPLWSHVRFDISEEDGLIGVPDYLIAPASDIGTTFTTPIICVAEAKKDNFNEGWAQTLAEMIASQRFNKKESSTVYGIVTTGNFWQFGKLVEGNLTIDPTSYSATENLQNLFDILNNIFTEAKKNL